MSLGAKQKSFGVWRQRKLGTSARGRPLELVVLPLVRLFDGVTRAVPLSEIAALPY
jgi:hypothetical protein